MNPDHLQILKDMFGDAFIVEFIPSDDPDYYLIKHLESGWRKKAILRWTDKKSHLRKLKEAVEKIKFWHKIEEAYYKDRENALDKK